MKLLLYPLFFIFFLFSPSLSSPAFLLLRLSRRTASSTERWCPPRRLRPCASWWPRPRPAPTQTCPKPSHGVKGGPATSRALAVACSPAASPAPSLPLPVASLGPCPEPSRAPAHTVASATVLPRAPAVATACAPAARRTCRSLHRLEAHIVFWA